MEERHPAFTHHATSATHMEINPVGFVVDREQNRMKIVHAR